MKNNPGRKQRRRQEKKKSDLARKSTHVMRSKMGMTMGKEIVEVQK